MKRYLLPAALILLASYAEAADFSTYLMNRQYSRGCDFSSGQLTQKNEIKGRLGNINLIALNCSHVKKGLTEIDLMALYNITDNLSLGLAYWTLPYGDFESVEMDFAGKIKGPVDLSLESYIDFWQIGGGGFEFSVSKALGENIKITPVLGVGVNKKYAVPGSDLNTEPYFFVNINGSYRLMSEVELKVFLSYQKGFNHLNDYVNASIGFAFGE